LEAAVWREDKPGWTQQDELIACLIETTATWGQHMVHALIAVHGGRPPRVKPMRIEHPDRDKAEEEEVTTDPVAIASFFGLKMKRKEVSE
jgi:hypothetical protein